MFACQDIFDVATHNQGKPFYKVMRQRRSVLILAVAVCRHAKRSRHLLSCPAAFVPKPMHAGAKRLGE